MSSPRPFISVDSPSAADSDLGCLRRSLSTLARLRGGWRPDESLLANARRVERWTVRHDDATYQFIGFAAKCSGITSMIVATPLAIDPVARWALLFADTWVVLGDAAPSQVDPADVASCAEAWLRRELP